MILLNFAHPLVADQVTAVERLSGRSVERLIDIPVRFDPKLGFTEQCVALVEAAGLSPAEWETAPLIVNLPGFAPIAALVLAQIHGRRGHFATVLRLRTVDEGGVPGFEVAEILNLQTVREAARDRRVEPGASAVQAG